MVVLRRGRPTNITHRSERRFTGLNILAGRTQKYTKRASRRSISINRCFLPASTYSAPLTPLPHEGVFGIERVKRERAIAHIKPPYADGPADSPSIRNANAASGGNGGNGNDPPPSLQLSAPIFSEALNRTPELPNPETSIYLPPKTLKTC